MQTSIETEFENAIMQEDADKILALLQQGANPNQKLEIQAGPDLLIIERPLHRVSSPEIITILLTFGADPNAERVSQYKFEKKFKSLIRYWVEDCSANSNNYYQRAITLLQFKPYSIDTIDINCLLVRLLSKLAKEDELTDEPGALIIALIQASTNLKLCIFSKNDSYQIRSPASITHRKGLSNVLTIMLEQNFPFQEAVSITECQKYGVLDEQTQLEFKSLYENRPIKKFMDSVAIWQLLRFAFFQEPTMIYLPIELIQSILLTIVDLFDYSSESFRWYLSYRKECSLPLQIFDKICQILMEGNNSLLTTEDSDSHWHGEEYLAAHFFLTAEQNLNKNPSELSSYAWLLTKLHYKNYSAQNKELKNAITYWYKKEDTKLSWVPTLSFFDSPDERSKKLEERVHWHLSQPAL